MRKLHFLKIPFGFDFKFNYSDMYECNGGQNYENLIWELLSLLDAVLDRRAYLHDFNEIKFLRCVLILLVLCSDEGMLGVELELSDSSRK